MKKITLYFLLFIPFLAFSQAYQTSAPWMQDNNLKKKGKITLDDISIAAKLPVFERLFLKCHRHWY